MENIIQVPSQIVQGPLHPLSMGHNIAKTTLGITFYHFWKSIINPLTP